MGGDLLAVFSNWEGYNDGGIAPLSNVYQRRMELSVRWEQARPNESDDRKNMGVTIETSRQTLADQFIMR